MYWLESGTGIYVLTWPKIIRQKHRKMNAFGLLGGWDGMFVYFYYFCNDIIKMFNVLLFQILYNLIDLH